MAVVVVEVIPSRGSVRPTWREVSGVFSALFDGEQLEASVHEAARLGSEAWRVADIVIELVDIDRDDLRARFQGFTPRRTDTGDEEDAAPMVPWVVRLEASTESAVLARDLAFAIAAIVDGWIYVGDGRATKCPPGLIDVQWWAGGLERLPGRRERTRALLRLAGGM